jgi:hypothetical protein
VLQENESVRVATRPLEFANVNIRILKGEGRHVAEREWMYNAAAK